jgi:hypothetical protein
MARFKHNVTNETIGFGRYITVTPERKLISFIRWRMAVAYNRYKFVTVSLLKRLRGGRFASKTATWMQKWFKIPVGTSRKL